MQIRTRPLFTDVLQGWSSFKPEPGSAYLYATSFEDRAQHTAEWEAQSSDVIFVPITEQSQDVFVCERLAPESVIRLRSGKDLRTFWRRLERRRVYLDITGLEHSVWAPLLKSGLSLGIQLSAVYNEPAAYRFNPLPREGDIFDLSERIAGLSPLPGFASLAEAGDDEQVTFVALLGFEGVRFKFCVEQVQPPRSRIIPVIGVPGFQAEYPFYSYDGNKPVLEETGAWSRVRFAKANCPFSLFYLLEEIASQHPLDVMKIATIGTKPHALGAVLFSLLSPRSVELIYDHPIRKVSRTEGTGRLLVYDIHALSSLNAQ